MEKLDTSVNGKQLMQRQLVGDFVYGHEFEQALGVGDGQEGLTCCIPWGCKESDTTA